MVVFEEHYVWIHWKLFVVFGINPNDEASNDPEFGRTISAHYNVVESVPAATILVKSTKILYIIINVHLRRFPVFRNTPQSLAGFSRFCRLLPRFFKMLNTRPRLR